MVGQLPQDNQLAPHQQPMHPTLMQQNVGQTVQQHHHHRPPTSPALRSAQPSPNMSPNLSSPQHAPCPPPSDPHQNHHDQAQVLQPILPQPLFQHEAGQTNHVVLGPDSQQNQHQHAVILNQIIQPRQIQQLPTQQPPPMIQTPILSSNSPTSPKPKPATTIKKSRFRVVKGTVPIDNHPAPIINDAQESLETNSAHVVSTIKRGRFVVKKGTAPATTMNSNSAAAKGTDYASDTSLTPTKQIAGSTKQKGRFLVKTGGSTANLQAQDATLSTIASGAVTIPSTTSQQNANNGMVSVDASDNVMGTAAYNVCPEQSDGYTSNEFASSEGVAAVATKKKGRFVVKTGGGVNNNAMHPPPELNATIPAQEGMQNFATGSVPHVPLANPDQIPVPTVGVPTTALGTGQVMGASNGPVSLIQALPQQPLQQNQVPQLQLQSQPQSEPSQPPVNANLQLPLAPRRVVTDDRASDYASSGQTENNIPRSNRPIASSSSNGTRGKNGSMIGGSGGVGKLLHYLDTIRSEVVDADRCIASLQSDKRFLRDKNKELESKIKELERRLAEEKSLRVAVDAKYRSLRKQISEARHVGEPTVDSRISKDHRRVHQSAHEVLPVENLEGKQLTMSANISMQQDNTIGLERSPLSNTSIFKSAKHNIRPAPPLSRNNSFDKAPIVLGLNSKSFAGLGSTAPSSPIRDANSVASNQTCTSTINYDNSSVPSTAKSSLPMPPLPTAAGHIRCATNPNTTHFDPLGTPKCKSKGTDDAVQVLANNGTTPMPDFSAQIAQINRTASESFVSVGNDDTKCTTKSKANHFDPMGTPKCNPKTEEDAMNAMKAMKNNGLFQLPDLDIGYVNIAPVPAAIATMSQQINQHQQQILEDDPFDEIVRHNRG